MAFSPFTAGLFTAGQILTAAQLNTYIRDNIMAGGPVYATEAARNADIPTPYEGQRAYITGSTVAAATGLVTAVPTGIQTIYNGAAWVCVTPVGADTSTGGTTTSLTYTATLTSGGTNPSVTLATGTTALVSFGSVLLAPVTGVGVFTAVAVSGATTQAASDNLSVSGEIANYLVCQNSVVFTGLTAGTNTFTLQYRLNTAGTLSALRRRLIVQGIA